MLDPSDLTDPDPKVAALLALGWVSVDVPRDYARTIAVGLVGNHSDDLIDRLLDEIRDNLRTADRLSNEAGSKADADYWRDEWIGHARWQANHAVTAWVAA